MGQNHSREQTRILTKLADDMAVVKTDIAGLKTKFADDMADVKTDVAGLKIDVAGLKIDVASIKDNLLVPEGNAESIRFAVTIKKKGNLEGHGAVVVMKKKSSDGVVDNVDEVYLLSAAHVLISIAKGEIFIQHVKNDAESFKCYADELCITKEYVSHGLKDYGFVKLLHKNGTRIGIRDNIETVGNRWSNPSNPVEVGKSVVAYGRVFLRGTITSTQESGRFSVLAHSVPGQSGSLVFNNNKSVEGVVHGSSKHRGKHEAAAHEDDAAVVYCDTVDFEDLICVNDMTHVGLLQWAECVPEKVTSGKVQFIDYTKTIEGLEKQMIDDLILNLDLKKSRVNLTLQEVMMELARRVQHNRNPVSFLGTQLVELTSLVTHVEELADV